MLACFALSPSIVLAAISCSASGNNFARQVLLRPVLPSRLLLSRLAITQPSTLICTTNQAEPRQEKAQSVTGYLILPSVHHRPRLVPGPLSCNQLSRPKDHLITCDKCLLIAPPRPTDYSSSALLNTRAWDRDAPARGPETTSESGTTTLPTIANRLVPQQPARPSYSPRHSRAVPPAQLRIQRQFSLVRSVLCCRKHFLLVDGKGIACPRNGQHVQL